MNKLSIALLAGLFIASLSLSAMALDAAKTTDMAKKAADSVKSTAIAPAAKPAVVAPTATPAPVVAAPAAEPVAATPETKTATKPMSHKKHKHGKKAVKK